jgi:hypothetical protein
MELPKTHRSQGRFRCGYHPGASVPAAAPHSKLQPASLYAWTLLVLAEGSSTRSPISERQES